MEINFIEYIKILKGILGNEYSLCVDIPASIVKVENTKTNEIQEYLVDDIKNDLEAGAVLLEICDHFEQRKIFEVELDIDLLDNTNVLARTFTNVPYNDYIVNNLLKGETFNIQDFRDSATFYQIKAKEVESITIKNINILEAGDEL